MLHVARPSELRLFAYDTRTRRWSARARHRLDDGAVAIGDFWLSDDRHGLVIERDNAQGAAARVKRVYAVTLGAAGAVTTKRLAVDLLDIADPAAISEPGQAGDIGLGAHVAFPFQTIESVVALDDGRLVIANDNNFPFS